MKRKKVIALITAALTFTMTVCGSLTAAAASELTAESKPATQYTIDANQEVYALLDFEDTAEFENATKGQIASPDTLDIYDENGKLVWSQTAYAFLDQDAPDTANPSLWRDTQLNHIYGLFEVTDGIYQVRGYDMSNITFIKGDTGWIVVDPLMSVECAQAALALVEENLGTFPVKAVIYSHSHVDHFGGVKGIVSEEEVQAGNVQVIAPTEMNFWIESKNALWMAENCTGTLHNLYTLRGAQVRDGNAWAEYIMESLALYGDKADVVFQSHNWPHWGNDTIQEYMTNTAAVYKFINDQTLLYINEGYTETEIANMIQLPEELEKVWYTRQYYGTVSHNSKAVYEKYMGWYDANPVHLAELTPSDYAQKLVEYFGDTDAVLEKAKEDFEKGEYQWVAQITNTLVYADPENMDARYLCADALEQLGYQAESGPWRNAYLCAAQELRNGTNTDDATRSKDTGDAVSHMTPDMILDYLGILVDTTKVSDLSFTANIILPEGNYVLRVKNGVLLYQKDAQDADADVTWTTKRAGLLSIAQKNAASAAALIEQEGDETCLTRLMDAVTVTSEYKYFNIIEP